MNRIFFLLLNAGLSLALQYPLEYKYHYQGSVFTGIPEIHHQTAALSLKGDLIAQVHQDGSVLMKLDEDSTSYSEYHGDEKCERGQFPGQFGSYDFKDFRKIISAPFKAHLFDGNDESLQVCEEEFAFTNIRKGLVSAFRNELLNSNFEGSCLPDSIATKIRSGHVPSVFTVQEETIFGLCNVEYNVRKLDKLSAQLKNYELEKQVEFDIQRDKDQFAPITKTLKTSKTSKKYTRKSSKKYSTKSSKKTPTKISKIKSLVPDIEDDLWHVFKSVNLDRCSESVVLSNSDFGINKDVDVGQYESLGGRNSVTEFLLRGSGGAFRIEKSLIEGTMIASVYGPKAESFQVTTKQTLDLVSVSEVSSPIELLEPVRTHHTWMHEFKVPNDPPKISEPVPWLHYGGHDPDPSFYEYVYGFNMPYGEKDFEYMKGEVIKSFKKISELLADTTSPRDLDAENTFQIIQLMKYYLIILKTEHRKEIVKEIMVEASTPAETIARKLMVDFLATNSYVPGTLDILLELLENDQIEHLQELTIYMTALHKSMPAKSLMKFMHRVINIDLDEHPILGSTALVNYFAALRKTCIDNMDKARFFENPEDSNCRETSKDQLMPFIKELIYNEKEWKQILGLSIFRELKTPISLKFVHEIVYAKKNDITLPKVALTLLESWNNQPVIRKQAMVFLEKVYFDKGFHPQIRQLALYTLISWNPESHFFYRLARSTWAETSKDMIIFTNGLLKAIGETPSSFYLKQSQAAASAMKFMRPINPSITLEHSFIVRHIIDRMDRQFIDVSESRWSKTGETKTFDATTYMEAIINGFSIHMLTSYVFHNANNPSKPYSGFTKFGSAIEEKIANALYEEIQETINALPYSEAVPSEDSSRFGDTSIFMKFLNNIRLYIPINRETKNSLPFLDPGYQTMIMMQAATTGYERNFAGFFPLESSVIMPTDLGMPALSHIQISDIYSIQQLLRVGKDEQIGDFVYKELFQINTGIQVGSVLGQSIAGALLRTTTQLDLPLAITAGEKGVTIDTLYDEKFTPIKIQNTPLTYIVSHFFERGPYEEKIVQKDLKTTETTKDVSLFGIDAQINWNSKLSSPLSILDPKAFQDFPPSIDVYRPQTIRKYSLSLSYNPQKTRVRKLIFSFINKYEPSDGPSPITQITQMGQEQGEFGQEYGQSTGEFGQEYGQEAGNFAEFGQKSGQSSDFGESGQFGESEQFGESSQFGEAEDFGAQTISQTEKLGSHEFSNIDIKDTFEERAEKLKTYWEIKKGSAMSLRIKGHGTEEREIEFVLGFINPEKSKHGTQYHADLAILRAKGPSTSDLKVCVHIDHKQPHFGKLTTKAAALNSKVQAETHVTLMDNCQGAPIISLHRHAVMSDRQKERAEKNECDRTLFIEQTRQRIGGRNLEQLFIFDDIHYDIEWQKIDNAEQYPITTRVTTWFGYLQSLSNKEELCKHNDGSGSLKVDFERCNCGKWKVSSGEAHFEIQQPLINNFLDHPIEGHHRIVDYESPSTRKKCFISSKEVRTLHHEQFEFTPTSCWTVAMTDCYEVSNWMVLVKESSTERDQPEVRYINKKRALVILIDTDIKVNGKIINPIGQSERLKGIEVYKNDEILMVKVAGMSIAVVNGKVIITPAYDETRTCGLCGNLHLLEDKMIGPQKCVYSNPKLFAHSWTGPSDKCDLYTILGLRTEVEEYQKNCLTEEMALEQRFSQFEESGFEVNWPLKELDGLYCISHEPLGHCKTGYDSLADTKTKAAFKCFKKDRVSSAKLGRLFEEGQEFSSLPADGRPFAMKHIELDLPDSCVKSIK